jgi:NAD(P)H-dependent FMN reductase
MSYFLALSGSSTKFSKSGFLLRTVASILQQRAIEFRAIYAVDFPAPEDTNHDLTDQFIADTGDEVRQASAILLVAPATKERVPALLSTLFSCTSESLETWFSAGAFFGVRMTRPVGYYSGNFPGPVGKSHVQGACLDFRATEPLPKGFRKQIPLGKRKD